MKIISYLSLFNIICFGFTLVLVGNIAEAQNNAEEEAGLKVIFSEARPEDIEIRQEGPSESKKFEVQLTDAQGDGIPDAVINFAAIPGTAAVFFRIGTTIPSASTTTDTNGIAAVDVQFIQSGTVTIRGALNLPASRANGVDTTGLIDGAFAGHDFKVIEIVTETVTEEVVVASPESTSIVVLPPIPYSDDHVLLSDLVSSDLSEIVEKVGAEDITPTSLEEIRTHNGLLQAIKSSRDALGGLAARYDFPDPAVDPNKYDDNPPNMFRVPIVILNAEDLVGWQFDISYNPQILEIVQVSEGDYAIFEGDFLKQRAAPTFFHKEQVRYDSQGHANIVRISQARIRTIFAANGTGELVSICFRVKAFAEESLGVHNVQLSDKNGERLDYTTIVHPVVVTHQFPPEDVNRDTVVDVRDLVLVAANLGFVHLINPRIDVNDDGIVNVLDLIMVAQHLNDETPPAKVRDMNMPAPSLPSNVLAVSTIQGWIDRAQIAHDGSAIFDQGIANLKTMLASRIPSETKLLLNYPNPFNPETWIPYQLAKSMEVTIFIYAVDGNLIRTLELGYQVAGIYHSKSQAAYWNGRNEFGERVASGVYFYTFAAGNFSATGKMLVRK